MSNFPSVIRGCEAANGEGSKQAIKEQLAIADATAQRLLNEALNPYRVFGVKKFDQPTTYGHTTTASYTNFLDALDKLASREVTGNAARELVTDALARFSKEDAEIMTRVVDKDLACGFSAETVCKVFKNLVPSFKVMLADKCDSTDDFETYVTFPCQADHKLDGERTIAIVKDNEVTYYSRSGKEAAHVAGLFDEELLKIRGHLKYDFILDGERYASNFTETMNAKKSGNDEAKKNLRLMAFFIMPLHDWLKKATKITMRQNRVFLGDLLKKLNCKKIILTEGREVTDYQDMMNYCNEVIDECKVEGLILKNWDSTYTWDRSYSWTKIKRFFDVDCRIVGFYAGQPRSRLENTLGGIKVVGFTENGTRVECNVGSGFSDALRAEIWNSQESWMGRTVVIKYQEVSKAKGKEHASLRFPTFERDRDDKEVEI